MSGAGDGRKVCLLTGAGGRLGEAFCRMFGAHYDIVAVLGRRVPQIVSQHQWWIDPLDPGAALPENESRVFAIHADLTDDAELRRVVEVTLARAERIDVLVNAAAVAYWAADAGRQRADRQFTPAVRDKRAIALAAEFTGRKLFLEEPQG